MRELLIKTKTNMALRVVCLGHSFIRRFGEFMDESPEYHNLRLDPGNYIISCRAQGGLKIDELIHERPDLFDFNGEKVDILYLQIGGNDLSDRNKSGTAVANDIYSLACFLHYGLQIPIVIIGELLWRHPKKWVLFTIQKLLRRIVLY